VGRCLGGWQTVGIVVCGLFNDDISDSGPATSSNAGMMVNNES